MEITITKKIKVEVKTLQVEANVRYWEDSEWNGVQDTDNGDLALCKEGSVWKPIIDLESGYIKNWKQGTSAEIHYKIADEGSYYLLDENNDVVKSIENHYVPSILCPKENGYGDYIIMDIDKSGKIENWECQDLDAWETDDDCDC